MRTIAYQKRSEELAQKQPELHEDTYVQLRKFEYKNEGFTLANIVNEAVAQFLGVGDLARIQERVEDRLEEKGIPLPPGSQRELREKINRVAEDETEFHKVFNVCSVGSWQDSRKQFEPFYLKLGKEQEGEESNEIKNLKIHFNTSYDIWKAVSEAPGYRSYIVNTAVEWWFDSPFQGSCDHVRSLHQLLAAAEGDSVRYEEATDWVKRRMDGIRKESDGKHLAEWESVFGEVDGERTGIEWEEITIFDDVVVSKEAAVEAMKAGELKETWKNRTGVLCAVLRNNEPPEDYGFWTREAITQVNEAVNADMGEESQERYLEKAFLHINPEAVKIETPKSPVDCVGEVSELYSNMIALGNGVMSVIEEGLDVSSRPTSGFELTPAEAEAVEEYTAELIRLAPSEVWETADGAFEDKLKSAVGEHGAKKIVRSEIERSTSLSL